MFYFLFALFKNMAFTIWFVAGNDSCKVIVILQRITLKEIKSHPWFLKNLPRELTDAAQAAYYRKENPYSLQSVEEITKIVAEAKAPPPASRSVSAFGWGGEEDEEKEDVEEEVEEDEDEEDEYDKQVKEAQASGEVPLSYREDS